MLSEETLDTVHKAVEDAGYVHRCHVCNATWWSKRVNTGACHKCGSWVVSSQPASHRACTALGIAVHPEG